MDDGQPPPPSSLDSNPYEPYSSIEIKTQQQNSDVNSLGQSVSFTDDYLKKPYETIAQFSLLTKIHVVIACLTCILCFLVWHYVVPDPKTSFWWWIYPFFFFGATLSAQVHYQNEQYFRGIVITVVLINFMLFLTDGLTTEGFPEWWFYPAGISCMILLAIHTYKYSEFSIETTCFYEYCIANTLMFLGWLQTPGIFPWWIIPIFILAAPLAVVYMRNIYGEMRIWVYFIVCLILINIMFFLIWGFVESNIPWFLVIWVLSGAAVVFLYWRNKDGVYEAVKDVNTIVVPQ